MQRNVMKILSTYNGTNLLNILWEIQRHKGYLSENILKKISSKTGIPISQLYGVVTFYAMFHTKKQGKNIIYICNSPSCYLNGSVDILKYLEKKLKIKVGQTTKDRKFSLYKTSCIGCCDKAPAMLINGKAYTKLTPKKIDSILKKVR